MSFPPLLPPPLTALFFFDRKYLFFLPLSSLFHFILFIPSLKQFTLSQERNHNQFKTTKPMSQIWPISCFRDTLCLTCSFASLFTMSVAVFILK